MFALRTSVFNHSILSGVTKLPIITKPVNYLSTKRAGTVFADPTYDSTFKMLCTNKEHPGIIKSILNSFLDFEGENKIEKVVFSQGNKIDLVCTSQNGKKMAIEMQRAHESYSLARSQMCMSKLIASQVAVGQSSKAHEVILDTYVICIGRENIIRKPSVVQKQKVLLKEKSDLSYSLTVTPTIHDFGITIEDNKMTWKFFELKKFKEFMKNIKIGKDSPIKHQWMKFLLKCQDEENTPEDVAEIIKEGYRIMEMANWTQEQKALYDMEIDQEELTLCKIEQAELDGKAKGLTEGKIIGLTEGKIMGLTEGKIIGLVKGEAKSIQKALKYNESEEEIINDHTTLSKDKLVQIKALPQPPGLEQITSILQDNTMFSQDKEDVDVLGNTSEENYNDVD
ncbi:MAG TPA: PD-(D/E)XK nuclease family transposase [Candidatus Megaira endosymbiont of Nemacystus decipiens]|nr:PD-(D/E)XK nuclease family transposase [Candidatus Megaera endosymbiont of Nemacystus decipiens]